MKKSPNNIKGAFTIIELLVVIAIIAILTAIIVPNLTGSKAKARDAKRVSDLGQIQIGLELFYDRCKVYPSVLDPNDDGGGACPDDIVLSTFLPKIPTAPASNIPYADAYNYYPDNSSGNQRYYLLVRLESSNPALDDDMDGSIDWIDTVNCEDPMYCLAN